MDGTVCRSPKIIRPVSRIKVKTITDTPNPMDNLNPTDSENPQTDSEVNPPVSNKKKTWWGGAFSSVSEAAGLVGNAVGGVAGSVGGTVAGAAGTVGGAIVVAGNAMGDAAGTVGGAVGGVAVVTAGAVGSAVGSFTRTVGGAVVGGISTATSSAGYLIDAVGNSPLIQNLDRTFQADWLLKILDQIDLNKAEIEVQRLKQEYPNESANQIAQRIIGQKAVLAGATGFATTIFPGSAAALFSVDLIATTSLQAEMVYQIACSYGMDLSSPTRKGEVIAVFGLAFGGKMAIKAGLGLLRNVPVAGTVIAVSSEAIMLYILGQASCAFYEAKLNPTNFEEKLEAIKKDSEERLESAISQEEIIDQILVHVILAGNQGRSKDSILTDLRVASLSSDSIDAIAEYMDSPHPLEILLTNIKPEFALRLLVQCQKIAMLDGIMTPEEAQVIELIHQKLV